METFFLISPLNFENTLEIELKEKFKFYEKEDPDYKIIEGGIEVTCTADQGNRMNYYLKCPTRILRRIKTQKCRDFPKLFNIIKKVQWKNYSRQVEFNWLITTKKSRLINTSKMEESCKKAIKEYFKANSFSQKILDNKENFQKQNIHIRVVEDNLQLSIDTSGDALYIRGGDSYRGLASIRSTLASCLLINFLKNKKKIKLVDPMCGSATFLKEARDYNIPNMNRSYAFEDYASAEKPNEKSIGFDIEKLLGFDIDSNIVNKQKSFAITKADAFKYKRDDECLVICNPPYGKRVKLSQPRDVYYLNLIKSLKENFKATEISIILPLDIKLDHYKFRSKIFNSGIWLYSYIL